MTLRDYAVLMARYNEWMNGRLYECAGRLTPEEFVADRGAYFGSVCGTFNHLVVADTIWLKRFAADPAAPAVLEPVGRLPMPTALDQVIYVELGALAAHRRMLDGIIKGWAEVLTDGDFDRVLHYANTRGKEFDRRLGSLVQHFFNHQTHHRGQATTLLVQMGQDVGVTDLLALIPTEAAA